MWHIKHFLLQLSWWIGGVDMRVAEAYCNTDEAPHNWTLSLERDADGVENPKVFLLRPKTGILDTIKFFVRWDSTEGAKVTVFAGREQVEMLALGWLEHKAMLWTLQEWIDQARDTGSLADLFKSHGEEILECL